MNSLANLQGRGGGVASIVRTAGDVTIPAVCNRGNIDGIMTDTWEIEGFSYIDYVLYAFSWDRPVSLWIDGTLVQTVTARTEVKNHKISTSKHTITIQAHYPGSGTYRFSGFTPHN